ncbi:hypothetical protein E8E13_009307 [Curvularia kusanoi]|uniref:Uncharacterized protein n=1 Tax=Curvularia kusanoi TaxID=90978 RepID=A0A9P4TFD4_CURKU|nr:hypothetical protein E8E13_009307 [Curvularia kusanoi]
MGLFKTLTLLALTTSTAFAKPYPVHDEELMKLHNATQIDKRADCAGVTCGWDNWLCCPSGSTCVTDANNQAQCGSGGSGGWVYYTTTYVETLGAVTKTSVGSSYAGGGGAAPATTATCSNSQQPCGSTCCAAGSYCYAPDSGTCRVLGVGSSGGILPTVSASAPIRPTQSTLVVITYTGTPTATGPFQTPVPTGASGSLTETGTNNGLSGGAIAGIVIGVLLGILLLLLLCLFCCARALFDTLLGILGIGGKRKHTHEETTYIEDHHHSGGAAAGGRWYGQGPSRPSRPMSEKKSGFGKGMGMAAALGGLALALGLKRRHDKEDKSTTISGSSYYYSDYTSSSSASSEDRHTRHTRQSGSRR